MRITNSMISTNSRNHISGAKQKLMRAEEQYTTEKKIQRPSDDPTIASRSLKYRTTLSQLTQYVEKNVEDAMDWMDMTESAMKNVGTTLTNMKGYLNQGATGTLDAENRNSVLAQLKQYATSIFEDEANSDYAGRFLFTGYRTDTSLLFPTANNFLEYNIKENFRFSDIDSITNVTSEIAFDENATAADYAEMSTKSNSCYRLQLSYDNCSKDPVTGVDGVFELNLSYKDATGKTVTETVPSTDFAIVTSDEELAYDIDAYNEKNGTSYKGIYVYDAGEVVFGNDLYGDIQEKEADFSINYVKKSFEKSDIRPEMYFECTCYDTVSMKDPIKYTDPSGQDIEYEVNFSQSIPANTQGKDAFDTQIYRCMDYIQRTVNAVINVEQKIADVEKKIANTTDETEIENLNQLKYSFEKERNLRESVMSEAFGRGLTVIDKVEQTLNVAVANLGARYNRMELTYNKLLDQRTDSEEKLSDNEDMDIADAIINMTQADNLYQSSLSATAKILGNSLLDYI